MLERHPLPLMFSKSPLSRRLDATNALWPPPELALTDRAGITPGGETEGLCARATAAVQVAAVQAKASGSRRRDSRVMENLPGVTDVAPDPKRDLRCRRSHSIFRRGA